MRLTIAVLQDLAAGRCAGALDEAARCGADPPVAAVARLREAFGSAAAAAALEIAAARRRAVPKFGARAPALFADREAVEQASSLEAAAHKARRFAAARPLRPLLDLCCGIGGDALGFRAAGLAVLGVDRDPGRAWMCARNAGIPCAAADAASIAGAGRFFHLDPSRRDGRGRLWRLEDLQPGPEPIAALVAAAPGGAVKLGPGLDAGRIPFPAEIEYLSEGGRLTQAIAWFGALGVPGVRATILERGEAHTLHRARGVAPLRLPFAPRAAFIHTVDPSIERAGLLAELALPLDLSAPHPSLGLLSGPAPVNSPWLTPFEVLADLPFQPRRLREALRSHGAGAVEVKTRGRAIPDAAALARDLRGSGPVPLVLFVLREGSRRFALLARRAQVPGGPP